MDSEEPQQPAVGEPAGKQLKKAREQLGLSVKDVADAQHLRLSIIQAIEDGNYDQIDSELFLKGYVRVYAKQVGADADALIQSLDLELEPLRRERAKQEQEHPLVNIERRRLKKRRVAKALILIVILGAAALATWKLFLEPGMATDAPAGEQQQSGADDVLENTETMNTSDTDRPEAPEQSEPQAVDNPEESAPEAFSAEAEQDFRAEGGPDLAASPEPTADLEPSASLEPSARLEPADSSATLSDGPETQAGQVVTDIPSPEGNSGAGVAGSDDVVTEETPQNAEVVSVEPVVQADPVFAESAQPDAVAPAAQLEMAFESDCWVQITDSSGARLLASLQRAGDRVSVSGRTPFNVVIGAVDAVDSMSFGGKPVDLSGFRVVNNRTEFTLTL